jgi:hypothetical protein
MMIALFALVAITPPASAQTEKKKSGQDTAAAADSKVTVWVYRYKQYAGSALEPSVYCDEGELDSDGRLTTCMERITLAAIL